MTLEIGSKNRVLAALKGRGVQIVVIGVLAVTWWRGEEWLTDLTRADEGMWIPLLIQKLNYAQMKKEGLKLSAKDLYDINHGSLKDAIVSFGGFCTGEIISSQGLLLTNHHCGYDAIQSHSSIEDNLLEHGFWAKSYAEEKPNPGLFVDFVLRTEDVTLAVQSLIAKGQEPGEAMKDVAAAQPKPDASWIHNVKPIFAGNRYVLTSARRYPDVRLVGAPPSAVGKYGSDTDNWVWLAINSNLVWPECLASRQCYPVVAVRHPAL